MEETNKYIEVTDAMKIARAKKDNEYDGVKKNRMDKLFAAAKEQDQAADGRRRQSDGRIKVNRGKNNVRKEVSETLQRDADEVLDRLLNDNN